MREEEIILTVLSMLILSGVSVMWLAMWNRRKVREMEHRERLAMIERGLVPAPETDPLAFEMRTGLSTGTESPSAARARSGGIFMMGLGLAMMALLTFAAGQPQVGLGVGGALAVLGATFLFNSMMSSRSEPYQPSRAYPPTPRPDRFDSSRGNPQSGPPPNVAP